MFSRGFRYLSYDKKKFYIDFLHYLRHKKIYVSYRPDFRGDFESSRSKVIILGADGQREDRYFGILVIKAGKAGRPRWDRPAALMLVVRSFRDHLSQLSIRSSTIRDLDRKQRRNQIFDLKNTLLMLLHYQ